MATEATIKVTDLPAIPASFFHTLRKRNPALYFTAWTSFVCAFTCLVMTQATNTSVLGINAWIKPMKFFISIGILGWTMAWFLAYLQKKRAVRIYTIVFVIAMIIEMVIITWQAANGRQSHFNISTPLYDILFAVMGIAITTFTLWTGYIAVLFFKQKDYPAHLPAGYIWGIRLGMLMFVLFALEGGVMAYLLTHTIGAADGGEGIAVLNWSKQHGDLRIAHFFGMHALQLIPLFGFYIGKKSIATILFALAYFVLVTLLLIQALQGIPLFF